MTTTTPEVQTQTAPPPVPAGAMALPGGESDPIQQARLADVLTRVADFLQLSHGGGNRGATLPLDFLLDVSVSISAELGHASLPIGDVLNLEPGSVVELDRDISHPVDLVVCGVLFARGEVVVVEDRFAVRIKELLQSQGKKGK